MRGACGDRGPMRLACAVLGAARGGCPAEGTPAAVGIGTRDAGAGVAAGPERSARWRYCGSACEHSVLQPRQIWPHLLYSLAPCLFFSPPKLMCPVLREKKSSCALSQLISHYHSSLFFGSPYCMAIVFVFLLKN